MAFTNLLLFQRTMKKPHVGNSHVRPVNEVDPIDQTYEAELVTPEYNHQALHGKIY